MKSYIPPKTILAAVDNTPPSWAAFDAAKALSERFKATLETLYVEPILPTAEFEPSLELAQEIQRGLRAEIKARVEPASAFHATKGQPIAEIIRHSGPRAAQLLVMGTHGRAGGERFLFGSVAEAVFHRARIPVLAVREGMAGLPKRLLVPCNLEPYADEALRYGVALAQALGAEITALYVSDKADADESLRRHLESELGPRPTARVRRAVRSGEARAEIADEAKSERHDLLILSGHKRAQLSDLALGTTAERLLRSCGLPLLAVPAKAGKPQGADAPQLMASD